MHHPLITIRRITHYPTSSIPNNQPASQIRNIEPHFLPQSLCLQNSCKPNKVTPGSTNAHASSVSTFKIRVIYLHRIIVTLSGTRGVELLYPVFCLILYNQSKNLKCSTKSYKLLHFGHTARVLTRRWR